MLVLTPGNTADCVMAEACVSLIPGVTELLADKGYDTDAFRAFLKDNDSKAIIPGKSNRKKRIRHDKEAYKGRNVIERCFAASKPSWRSSYCFPRRALALCRDTGQALSDDLSDRPL